MIATEKSKNAEFGFKVYYGWDKWKIEFDEQKCKGLIHE